jgi:hypothetical protein
MASLALQLAVLVTALLVTLMARSHVLTSQLV